MKEPAVVCAGCVQQYCVYVEFGASSASQSPHQYAWWAPHLPCHKQNTATHSTHKNESQILSSGNRQFTTSHINLVFFLVPTVLHKYTWAILKCITTSGKFTSFPFFSIELYKPWISTYIKKDKQAANSCGWL